MPKDTSTPHSHSTRKSPYQQPPNKKKPSSHPREKEEQNQVSINDLKRRIRDVKRLLNKPDLPADARILQERALAGYEKELADEERRRERSKLIKKYHFVRFLDRKTATKELSRLTRKQEELKKSESDSATKLAKLMARIHVARVNLNYTIYYPLTEKYISIYAKKKGKPAGQDQGSEDEVEENPSSNAAERTAMWGVVEKCMEDGTLDLLREGKRVNGDSGEEEEKAGGKTKEYAGSKKAGKEKKSDKSNVKWTSRNDTLRAKDAKHGPPGQDEEQDDSDGDFFEM
ncbi:hypothetical protein BDW59DRAFT_181667 [Aspergillus cavernicola]|uniref:rRNA-processing protein EFG1 n=1 Tax=Aspergillus cavernicola TaxID=176166 RepID=A0ABR4HV32_9EURO